MSDTDQEDTEFTVGQLTAIVAKLKKKLARFEHRLEAKILHETIASTKAGAAYRKGLEDAEHTRRVDVYNKAQEAKKNMPGATIPIGLAKKIVSYTIDQLQDFSEYIIDGIEYGINIRGDVVDTDGNFIGHYDEKTKKLLKGIVRPADWNIVMSMA